MREGLVRALVGCRELQRVAADVQRRRVRVLQERRVRHAAVGQQQRVEPEASELVAGEPQRARAPGDAQPAQRRPQVAARDGRDAGERVVVELQPAHGRVVEDERLQPRHVVRAEQQRAEIQPPEDVVAQHRDRVPLQVQFAQLRQAVEGALLHVDDRVALESQ